MKWRRPSGEGFFLYGRMLATDHETMIQFVAGQIYRLWQIGLSSG